MKNIVAALLLAVGTLAFAQPTSVPVTPKQPYDSTKALLAVEKLKNYDLQIDKIKTDALARINALGTQFQTQQKVIEDWAAAVRKANGWDLTYTYDADNDVWTHALTIVKPPAPGKK